MKLTAVHITDEITVCDCCGRGGLKKTVAMSDGVSVVAYYGTGCALKAMGWTAPGATTRLRDRLAHRRGVAEKIDGLVRSIASIRERIAAGETENATGRSLSQILDAQEERLRQGREVLFALDVSLSFQMGGK